MTTPAQAGAWQCGGVGQHGITPAKKRTRYALAWSTLHGNDELPHSIRWGSVPRVAWSNPHVRRRGSSASSSSHCHRSCTGPARAQRPSSAAITAQLTAAANIEAAEHPASSSAAAAAAASDGRSTSGSTRHQDIHAAIRICSRMVE